MTHTLILCPGQGAQAVGMGKAWHEHSPDARAVFAEADTIVGSRFESPLSTLCFQGPADRLNRTDASQPAIFVASIASWRGLSEQWQRASGGMAICATAGLSLGEYTALCVAGAFSFEDGLRLVCLRGQAMQEAADAIKLPDGTPGSGMVALIGADEAQATAVCDQAREGEVLVCANFNAPGQIVLSGSIGACKRSIDVASGMGLRGTALQVAGGFHSPLMRPAADRLQSALAKTHISAPGCPVACNVTGEVYRASGTQTIEETIRTRLVEQLTSPVRWAQNALGLSKQFGIVEGGLIAHELAPGKTLMGLMRRIDKTLKVEPHDEP